MIRVNLRRNWIGLIFLISISLMGEGFAKSTPKKKSNIEKIEAPTMDDYSSFVGKKQVEVSDKAQKKADQLSLKTISSIQKLLKSKKISKFRKFELLLRLGETYAERHDYLRKVEVESFGRKFDAWEAKGGKGKSPQISHNASKNELTKAVNSFRTLVNKFSTHPRSDAALFALGQALTLLGNNNAPMYFKQLIKKHPKSPLVPDTFLALGEFYFERNKVNDAINNYKQVLKYKGHRVYPYAVYKLGWSHFNAGGVDNKKAYKKAVAAFKLVIKISDTPQYAKTSVTLRKEAINDLVIVWSEAEDINSAWSYFQKIGEKGNFYRMLERLGYIYAESGRNKQALSVFNRLLKESPLRENNPQIYATVIDLHDLENKPNLVVRDAEIMSKLYLGNTAWTNRFGNAKGKESLVKNANDLVQRTVHKYGTSYHDIGQKRKSKLFLQSAIGMYSLYLKGFAKTTPAYEIRYYLAELLYDFKQYEQASHHFLVVSRQKVKNPKYKKTSALNAVAAMNTLVNSKKYPKLPPRGQAPSPLSIPKHKIKLVEVIDNYVSLFPKEKKSYPMRYTAADVFFDHGHYPKALNRFEKIIKEIPGTKQANTSIKLIIAFHTDKKNWNDVVNSSKKFLAVKGLLDPKMKTYVQNSLRVSLFKHGLVLEKANKRLAAAKVFMGFQKEFPKDKSADKAVYNAIVNYYKLGNIEDAMKASQVILSQYPKSKLKPDVLASMGQTYDSLADFENAAKYYAMLATSYPTDKRSSDALFNAGMLYKGLGKLNQSQDVFKKHIALFSKKGDVKDSMFELATVLEKNNKAVQAAKAYKDFANKYKTDVERSTLAQSKAFSIEAIKLRNKTRLSDLESLGIKLAKSKSPLFESRREVSAALFKLYEKDLNEYKRIKLNNGSKIEALVGKKNGLLVKLADKYQKIIDIGSGEYVVACMYRLGEMHENLSNELFNAPAPAGANQAAINQFKSELEKVAFPLKEEAYKFYESAFKRSKEVDTFTVWTQKTHEKMVQLEPTKHKEINVHHVKPGYLSHKMYIQGDMAGLVE